MGVNLVLRRSGFRKSPGFFKLAVSQRGESPNLRSVSRGVAGYAGQAGQTDTVMRGTDNFATVSQSRLKSTNSIPRNPEFLMQA